MSPDPSPFTLDSLPQASYGGCAADTAEPALREASMLNKLTADLTRSLRRPTRRTLTLIDKALAYLTPFESSKASVTSPAERHDLLDLLTTHRMVLAPYIDADRIESHLRLG